MDLLKSKDSSAFGDLRKLNLFLKKSHMLDHVVGDNERYGDLMIVDA